MQKNVRCRREESDFGEIIIQPGSKGTSYVGNELHTNNPFKETLHSYVELTLITENQAFTLYCGLWIQNYPTYFQTSLPISLAQLHFIQKFLKTFSQQ